MSVYAQVIDLADFCPSPNVIRDVPDSTSVECKNLCVDTMGCTEVHFRSQDMRCELCLAPVTTTYALVAAQDAELSTTVPNTRCRGSAPIRTVNATEDSDMPADCIAECVATQECRYVNHSKQEQLCELLDDCFAQQSQANYDLIQMTPIKEFDFSPSLVKGTLYLA